MPSTKQGGGHTLTFSKKNEDVRELLEEKKQKRGFVLTDYLCQAVRFYEENKGKEINNNSIDIESLVRKEMEKIIKNIPGEKERSAERAADLEDNLENVDIEDDD